MTQQEWKAYQARHKVPLIERTYKARTLTGRTVEVNRFDYNLAQTAKAFDAYIQLIDTSWIRLDRLILDT
jgi:hypothetical protein